ncbi:MAG TPA: response regulator [Tepidisphaeraceae bacterium]|nr:response regulator [Tepidisphaeraceae bacterium]
MKPVSILITDDESNIRMMLRTTLEADGYSVSEASNGREALASIERDRPDLMVLDLNMPELDGMAVLEQMKSIVGASNKPRVIILTAYGSIPTAVKATRLGAIDFLEKPITPNELRETVRSALTEPELDPQPGLPATTNCYEDVLDRIRKSLRLADFSNAESMLMKVADRPDNYTAQYYNLLGVLYEAQHKWRLARKCYGKAMRADKNYQPAQDNMRRIYELHSLGKSAQSIALGDEVNDVWA